VSFFHPLYVSTKSGVSSIGRFSCFWPKFYRNDHGCNETGDFSSGNIVVYSSNANKDQSDEAPAENYDVKFRMLVHPLRNFVASFFCIHDAQLSHLTLRNSYAQTH
jgi:hypothetical protein